MAKNVDNQSGVGPRLSALLKEQRLSNRAAAEIAGVSPTSIHDWKSGVTPTDYSALARLADFLGVQFRFLLMGEHEPNTNTAELTLPESFAYDGEAFTGICEVKIRKIKLPEIREVMKEDFT